VIRLGETYAFSDFAFVVVEETPYVPPYCDKPELRDAASSPGFRCLVLHGEFVTGHVHEKDRVVTPAGSHFVCAKSSAVAVDSVRFPREE
jgi:hypothetical protein